MDPQALSGLFGTTYSPDPNTRKSAELQIRALSKEEGMIAAVMQIIGAESVDQSIRQACAVWLKNRIERSWLIDPSKPDTVPVPASDRAALKSGLLQLLVTAPSRAIRLQLAQILRSVSSRDFPDEWPGYVDQVVALLSSQNTQEVYAGLVATVEPVKAFRYRADPKSLEAITVPTFPLLLQIGQNAAANPTAPLVPEFLHLIFQTYKNASLNSLLPTQASAESIVPWGRLMLDIVALQAPLSGMDPDDMEKHEWWKAKKWAFASLNLLFTRYGNPSQMPPSLAKKYKPFAENFVVSFAPNILTVYLEQARRYVAQETWLSNRALYFLGQFFTECIKPKTTWALLKPHFETLVSAFAFPQLCFTNEKKELWRDDPNEYLRSTFEEYDDYQSGIATATTFLLTLAKTRNSTTFIPTLTFVQNLLANEATPPEQRFGALNVIICLSSVIMTHPQVKADIDTFMLRHVIPLLSSEVGYLRAVAAETVGAIEQRFPQWKQPEGLALTYNAIVKALDDPETPVRVHAALALAEMLRHVYVKDAVKEIIGHVIETYLQLSEMTELDVLNSTMDTFVQLYADELLPVAIQLTTRLANTYVKYLHEVAQLGGNEATEEALEATENKMFSLAALLKTIGTIVTAMDTSAEITAQLQHILAPIIQITLETKVIDVLDHALDLVDSLTFNTKSIPTEMWPIFEEIYKLFKNGVVDYLDEMLPSLDNFMSYGKEVFFQRPDYCEMVVDIFETAMASEHLGEGDRVSACQLIEAFLLNLRGHVDDKLPRVITVSLKQLDPAPKTRSLRLANLNVLINAILYNTPLSFQIIESLSPNFSRQVFDKWFKSMNEPGGLPRVHDMKLSIMAMCGLLELDEGSIPPALREGWASIVPGLLTVFKQLPEAVNQRKKLQEELQEEDDEELDEEEDELILDHNDEEDVYDEDTAIRDIMARETERLQENANKLAGGQEIVDDEEDLSDEDIEEELGYISPLDTVDPYLAFKRSLSIFQMKNTGGYQAAMSSLNPEQQTLFTEVVKLAEQKEAEVGPVQI